MDITPEPQADNQNLLRFLKILVTSLTVTMIVGLIVLIGLIVMRFSSQGQAPLPESITLPSGVEATAFTRGQDWLAVVTNDGRILIFAPDGKTLRQEVVIEAGQ